MWKNHNCDEIARHKQKTINVLKKKNMPKNLYKHFNEHKHNGFCFRNITLSKYKIFNIDENVYGFLRIFCLFVLKKRHRVVIKDHILFSWVTISF